MRVDERQQLRLHAGGRGGTLLAGRHTLLMWSVSSDKSDRMDEVVVGGVTI